MKKVLSLILALAMAVSLAACGGEDSSSAAPASKPASDTGTSKTVSQASGELPKSACYITQYGLSAPFTAMCWEGVSSLEDEGWKVKCMEVAETTEFPDQIRAMAAEGYSVIVTEFDALAEVAVQLSKELEEQYPDLQIFLNDSYVDSSGTNNCANIICDPWESSFVAGFVAAMTTKKDVVGWIGHTDSPTQDRFRYGYEAGVKYAGNGKEVVVAYTGDSNDSVKGQEAAKAMIANYGVDTIYQAANTSGLGVILECKEAGIHCIGVDMWQGGEYGQETVFWSALKPINDAINECVRAAQAGEWEGNMFYYDLAHGAKVYDQRDFDLLDKDLQQKVLDLTKEIAEGKIDVYEGYDDYRYQA